MLKILEGWLENWMSPNPGLPLRYLLSFQAKTWVILIFASPSLGLSGSSYNMVDERGTDKRQYSPWEAQNVGYGVTAPRGSRLLMPTLCNNSHLFPHQSDQFMDSKSLWILKEMEGKEHMINHLLSSKRPNWAEGEKAQGASQLESSKGDSVFSQKDCWD